MESCKYCNSNLFYTKQKEPHVGLYCGDCGKFQKWLKQERNIGTCEIASEKQQKYAVSLIKKWEHSNKPMTIRQAGTIIQAFKV